MARFLTPSRYDVVMEYGTSAMMMVEGRRAERVRSFLRARILFNNGTSTIDCIVRNISKTGAKLAVGHAMSIPAEFDLEIPQRGRTYRAKMMWCASESVGVEFVEPGEAEVARATIERLEAENRKLRASLARATRQLEEHGLLEGAF